LDHHLLTQPESTPIGKRVEVPLRKPFVDVLDKEIEVLVAAKTKVETSKPVPGILSFEASTKRTYKSSRSPSIDT